MATTVVSPSHGIMQPRSFYLPCALGLISMLPLSWRHWR